MLLQKFRNEADLGFSFPKTAGTPGSSSAAGAGETIRSARHRVGRHDPGLDDDRFRNLLGDAAWARLPAPVRARFGKRLPPGGSAIFQGVVTQMFMTRWGWLLAQTCRLVGAPLPFDPDAVGAAAVVTVTEDAETGGHFWMRQYGRKSGFPQTVHSSKRFTGPTGLEEYVGHGIGMALRLEATDRALLFKSDHYYVTLFGMRLRLPDWLAPGRLTIGHHDRGNGRFAFTLSLMHPRLGVLIHQKAVFTDTVKTNEGNRHDG